MILTEVFEHFRHASRYVNLVALPMISFIYPLYAVMQTYVK